MVWQPTPMMLRTGKAVLPLGPDGRDAQATWNFSELNRSPSFGVTMACTMTIDGLTSHGYADHLSKFKACAIAMAEAWERHWVVRLDKTPIAPALPFRFESSNGFAAGPTDAQAIAWSRRELIERSLMVHAWETMRGWVPTKVRGTLGRFLMSLLAGQGWEVRLFTIHANDIKQGVLAAVALHRQLGLIFDSCGFEDSAPARADMTRILKSLIRGASHCARIDRTVKSDFPEIGMPIDHAKFYANPSHAEAVWALLDRFDAGKLTIHAPDEVTSRLLWHAGAFPAVAVSYHPHWPPLRWGGTSVSGANPWPHPLA